MFSMIQSIQINYSDGFYELSDLKGLNYFYYP